MSIFRRLSDAREDFHRLKLTKSGHNKFAGYYYFELGDFLIPALEVFRRHELFAYISFGKEMATMTIVQFGDMETGKLEITTPMSTAALKGCHEVQNLGAVQTYLRRYLWVAALEIVEHDAVDASKPIEPKLQGKKLAALDGIGDDLPDESKEALKDLAAEVTELCATDPQQALNTIRSFGPQGDEIIYLDRQLPSNVRSALRKAKQSLQQETA